MRKKMNKWKNLSKLKKVTMVLSIFLLITIVTATIITYFGQINTKLTVKQSIMIDNHLADNPISHNLKVQSGDSVSIKHTFTNLAKTCDANISVITTGLVDGLTLKFYDDDGSLITFPLRLDANTKMKFTMEYYADINLVGDDYTISSYFSASDI